MVRAPMGPAPDTGAGSRSWASRLRARRWSTPEESVTDARGHRSNSPPSTQVASTASMRDVTDGRNRSTTPRSSRSSR